ncbi:MAG: hypothetical protein NTW78_03895 [Campylobacterales bacterium]|nr:hypothetical protein [Campylobacterales bacterium]
MISKLKDICNRGFCTCFPDKWFGVDISECCKKHDEAYETQIESKEVGDEKLAKCVHAKVPLHKAGFFVAGLMWVGVRVGGYKTSWNRIKEMKKDAK